MWSQIRDSEAMVSVHFFTSTCWSRSFEPSFMWAFMNYITDSQPCSTWRVRACARLNADSHKFDDHAFANRSGLINVLGCVALHGVVCSNDQIARNLLSKISDQYCYVVRFASYVKVISLPSDSWHPIDFCPFLFMCRSPGLELRSRKENYGIFDIVVCWNFLSLSELNF